MVMSPQKLFFCYHLPTRGRAGVKLGDAWYVLNVSIIFYAPCLFTHHLLCVLLHFMRFYAFSGTNLLTRCHSASSLFSAIFVFQKTYTGNILGIGRNKSRTSYFYRSFVKTEDKTEGGPGARLTTGGAAYPLAAPPHGEASWPHLWRCPFAYNFPSTGKT
jgi:hypothetical protein